MSVHVKAEATTLPELSLMDTSARSPTLVSFEKAGADGLKSGIAAFSTRAPNRTDFPCESVAVNEQILVAQLTPLEAVGPPGTVQPVMVDRKPPALRVTPVPFIVKITVCWIGEIFTTVK